MSPIYCDNRLLLSDVEGRGEIVRGLTELFQAEGVQQVAGVATAGIAWGGWVADRLNLPFLYVRNAPKDHGKKNLIEGKVDPTLRTGIVEDLVSTGGSVLTAARELKKLKVPLVGAFAIFSYGFDEATKGFSDLGVSIHALVGLDDLLAEAEEQGRITTAQARKVCEWRANPRTISC
ncbi:MAG: orotate phosphoribosyltransferase [Pseudomonadota bacterium]